MDKEQELRPCPFCSRRLIMKDPVLRKWVHPLETQTDVDCAGSAIEVSDNPVRIAAWNRRSSDEQAEVVGWTDEAEIKALAEHGHGLINARRDEGAGFVVPLYRAPPAVAAGGVTEALRSAMGMCEQYADFIRHVPAAEIEQHPYLPELEQVIEVARAHLAVGDEGIREESDFAEYEGVTATELAATVARYGKALVAAKLWHEAEDKSLSKQPPTSGPNGSQWARLQHQEQIAEIDAALNPTPPSRGEGE